MPCSETMPGVDGWVDVGEYPTARDGRGLLVFRFDAPLFFMNAERFRDRVDRCCATTPATRDGRDRLRRHRRAGLVGVDMFAELLPELRTLGVQTIAVARANELVLDRLSRGGLLEPGGPFVTYPAINAAVQAYSRSSRAVSSTTAAC